MSILIGTFSRAVIKALGALALGSAVLCQVAAHSGDPNGTAYVHVSTPHVDVLLDGLPHRVETLWDSPIVCQLRPGKHLLQMFRNGETVYEEEFIVRAGDEIVLTAWDPASSAGTKPATP
jgi:hypothetical protein